jgi:bifunctional oligoribonuclease and PAP phosphatase NrnA
MQRLDDMQTVLSAIERGQYFLVSAHARPDGDAVGSILALGMILDQLGKQVEMVSFDGVPLIYQGLPCARTIHQITRVERNYDAVILLECDSIERSRLMGLEGRFIINIDHHASGRPFGRVNWIDTGSCAVAEMVYKLAKAVGVKITRELATCLYTAVLTDTGSFCYASTDAHTFELAGELVRRGADPAIIAQHIYFSNPASKMLLLGAALSNLKRDGRLAWMWVTHDDMLRTCAAEEDCEGLVNYAIGIAGVDVAVFLRELPTRRVRLSLRSKGELNVARIAERFGGGGHPHASGCTIDGPLSQAANHILDHLRECLQGPVHEFA